MMRFVKIDPPPEFELLKSHGVFNETTNYISNRNLEKMLDNFSDITIPHLIENPVYETNEILSQQNEKIELLQEALNVANKINQIQADRIERLEKLLTNFQIQNENIEAENILKAKKMQKQSNIQFLIATTIAVIATVIGILPLLL